MFSGLFKAMKGAGFGTAGGSRPMAGGGLISGLANRAASNGNFAQAHRLMGLFGGGGGGAAKPPVEEEEEVSAYAPQAGLMDTTPRAGGTWGMGDEEEEEEQAGLTPLYQYMQRKEEGGYGPTREGMVRIPGTGHTMSRAGLGAGLQALGNSFGRY